MQDAQPPETPTAARLEYHRLRVWVVAMLVISCAGPLSMNLVDPDLWGHVRYAQDWIAEGELPRTATHTFTAEGVPWINHENLAELLLATGFDTLGAPNLLVIKCLLGMAVLGGMWLVARRQEVRPIAAWSFFLLVATNLQAFWILRPQLLSFCCFAAMLLLLEFATRGWGRRRTDFHPKRRKSDQPAIDWACLAALPLLFALWANSHGGFLAGYAVLAVFLIGKAGETLLRQKSAAWRTAAWLGAVLVACGLATLANPYGFGLHAWMLESLGAARPEITEWRAPTPDTPVFWPFVLLCVVAVVALLLSDRRRDPVRVVILLLVGWQAASHLRHIAFFALLCGFWLPPHIQSVVSGWRNRLALGMPSAPLSPGVRVAMTVGLSVAILLQAVGLGKRLATLPVEKSRFPVDAVDWMASHQVNGKLVVCFNWAQYAIAALAPDVKVSFDGRFRTCYPQRVVDMNFDFLMGDRGPRSRDPESGPIDPAKVLSYGEPDYVLVDRNYWNAVGVMLDQSQRDDSEWVRVYQDPTAQLWGRRSVVDDPESDRYIAPELRRDVETTRYPEVPWPALPAENKLIQQRKASDSLANGSLANAEGKSFPRGDAG